MTEDSATVAGAGEGGTGAPIDNASVPSAPADRIEPFVLALSLGLGLGAVLLAVLTRKHLFARQIAPADSPIHVE